jgi:hypothetical protein
MKALFGVVSLLVALAIAGLVVVKQLKSVRQLGAVSTQQTGPVAAPALAGSGPVREQAQRLENQVASDVDKALQQGAARLTDADK